MDVFDFTANGGEGSNEILDFDTAVDRLNFTDLLEGGDGLDPEEVSDFLTNVTYENNGIYLVLTVPDQNDPVGGESTQITLAGVGGEFDIGAGNLSQLVAEINVDTYSS